VTAWRTFSLLAALALAAPARAEALVDSLEAPAAPNLVGLRGRLVRRVTLQIAPAPWLVEESLPSSAPLVGRPFREDEAQDLLRALLATGAYADGSIEAIAEGEGVLLSLSLTSRRVVDTLEVNVRGPAPAREEILRYMATGDGQSVSSVDVADAVARVRAMLTRRGYDGADVRVRTRETDRPGRLAFVLEVSGATERTIAAKALELERPVGTLTDGWLEELPRVGARIDEELLREKAGELQERMRTAGYFEASVSVRVDDANRVLLAVRPGARFRVRFEGADRFDEDTLRKLADFSTREGRDGASIAESVAAFYGARGYLDCEVRAELRRAKDGRLADLVMIVEEHERVPIVARSFPRFASDPAAQRGTLPRTVKELDALASELLREELPGMPFFRPVTEDLAPGVVVRSATGGETVERLGAAFFRPAYDGVREFIEESYRNEGFLQASAGPVLVVRKPCATPSPLGCPVTPIAPALLEGNLDDAPPTCDARDHRGPGCERGVAIVMPVNLGPRTYVAELAFNGVRAITEAEASRVIDLRLGEPASTLVFQAAADRLVEHYREQGYAFAAARFVVETSPNREVGRVRFDVNEGPLVLVDAIVLDGNESLSEDLLRGRISLEVGQPYRTSLARKSREALAALPAVANVTVSLDDTSVPSARQRVVVAIREARRQIIEVRPGASTGEGFRSSLEYTHRNLLSYGVSASTRIQLSYLPDFLLLDSVAASNIGRLDMAERLVARATAGVAFPDVGLGTTVRASIDLALIRDLQRDFRLDKRTVAATLAWLPSPEWRLSVGPLLELNTIRLFVDAASVEEYLRDLEAKTGQPVDINLLRLLRIPNGSSTVFAQKLQVAYDARDNAFNAHRGFFAAVALEHVDSFPDDGADGKTRFEGHFFRIAETFSTYVPLPFGMTWATQLRFGQIAHLTSLARSKTYPDRLFFLGGMDSVRGYLQDAFVPQDLANELETNPNFSLANVVSRGGNFFVNPRTEIRVPLLGALGTVVFLDAANLWQDPFAILDNPRSFTLRTTAGTGLRLDTPLFPIAIDVGWNLAPRAWEDHWAYHFAVGLF
jgi:outer membrane protein insertion porin family